MLIKESFRDVETKSGGTMRIIIIEPHVPEYPSAKFPGCVVFSEIYQVTGPVERFAGNIASQGFVVACPSSFHEFEGPEPIPYDTEGEFSFENRLPVQVLNSQQPSGTDRGNKYKFEKTIEGYDEDCTLSVDLLTSLPQCTGRIAATGMCLGGHLALRAAFDARVLATFCWFATDVHSATLGKGQSDDTLIKIKNGDMDGKGEVALVFGKQDTHVPREGRDLIRKTLEDRDIAFTLMEVQAQHAFIRDNSSKGRWDAALTRGLFGMMMELFDRTVVRDLGPRAAGRSKVEHVC